MNSHSDRDKSMNEEAAREAALEIRAQSRRNKMLGEWAAHLMGLENVDDYARAIVKSESDPPGEEDVLRKVSQDLAGSGLSVPVGEIRTKMDEFLAVARGHIRSGT